jgi:single-strand DNA-binding protein
MNKGYAMGFISSDIRTEVMNLKSGEQMTKARFSVACNKKSKDKNAGADFIGFVELGKTADNIAKWFAKGKGIFVEYHVSTGSYTNKEGKKVYTTDLVVDSYEFPPVRKNEEQAASDTHTENSQYVDANDISSDDIDIDSLPFR